MIYIDCDGVLANFEGFVVNKYGLRPRKLEEKIGASAFWKEMYESEVFRNLSPLDDANHLIDSIRHLNPTILTGTPWGNWAKEQKLEWRDKHFPGVPMIVCQSKEKCKHCSPGDILIDDWQKYRHLWIRAGGIFISHYDAESSLEALWAHRDQTLKSRGQFS
jgi:5'(3')-deoxyribonucleotidase